MEDSILVSIKKLLGIDSSYAEFDTDIIIHINTVLTILTQIGVGPETGFFITGDDETWEDFIEDDSRLNNIKSYMYMKVRMMFDPPTGGAMEAMNRLIDELEWRISVTVDPPKNN